MHFKIEIESEFGGNKISEQLIAEAETQALALAQAVHRCRLGVAGGTPELRDDRLIFFFRPGVTFTIKSIGPTSPEEFFHEKLYSAPLDSIDYSWAARMLTAQSEDAA